LTLIENSVRFAADYYASERAPDTRRGPFAYPEEATVYIDGNLDHTLWTTAEAAEAAGVTTDVIYQWKRRKKIQPVNRRGRPRYRALDVLQAEKATRERAHRTYTAA
jgi:hypothetical protein